MIEETLDNFKTLMMGLVDDRIKEERHSLIKNNDKILKLQDKLKKSEDKSKKLRKQVKVLKEYYSKGLLIDQNAMQKTIDKSVNDASFCIFQAFVTGMEECKVGHGTRTKIKLAMEKAVMEFDYPSYTILDGEPVLNKEK